jgi:hypothetical protein
MNESNYILATNLAKARIADGILRSLSPGKWIPDDQLREVIATVCEWVILMEKDVT